MVWFMTSLPRSPRNNALWRHACHITWLATFPFSMKSISVALMKSIHSCNSYLNHLNFPCSRC
uniref:Uncharacterized protein n=1 Tax=Arundo donax TaxID=35708 RepID=A0A0A9B671_ARUDO